MSEEIKYFDNCPTCNKIRYYKTRGSYYANRNIKRECWECKLISQSKKLKGKPRPPFSDEWRKNIATGHKKSKIWVDSMNTPEYKEKHRQVMIRNVLNGKTRVSVNSRACDFFNYLNEKLKWNGRHGKNNGEYRIYRYFLDYYEPTLKVIIEWDESHHNKTKSKIKDIIRQNYILENTKCEFYRIDDKLKKIKKVDSSIGNKTEHLQSIINEYYENK